MGRGGDLVVRYVTPPAAHVTPLGFGPSHPESDPLGDSAPLELGDRPENLHLELPGWRGCVDALGETDECDA